jgi:hypothetical protein
MSFRPFQTTANGSFDSQPSPTGEEVIVVSTDTGDAGAVITINGSLSSTADSEAVTLTSNGRIERETTSQFDALTALSSDTTLTGVLSLYGQGVAGVGDVTFTSIPTGALTLILGLVGYTQTYTYRSPCRETILCPAAANLETTNVNASYIKITLNGVAKYFWFSNAAGPTIDPTPGGTGYAVVVTSADSAATVATALLASMATNLTNFASSLDTATITITGIALGAITISQDAGADFTLTAVEAGTADAANQIRTSYDVDGSTATVTDVALWTQYAINASGGTAGTHYGTGTAANAYASASASTGTTTLTDRIACNRSLGWTLTAPASGATSRTLIGGANGDLLGSLITTDGVTSSIQSSQIFDNADLADDTLLALWTGATDSVLVNGVPSTLRLAINNVTSIVTAKIQASDDDTTWYDLTGTTALTGTVNASTVGGYDITGTGTLFTTELHVGDIIVMEEYAYEVASIASATALTVRTPLATDHDGASITKRNPVQISSLDNNSQFVAMPPVQYARLNVTANANTTDSKLHAGLIL